MIPSKWTNFWFVNVFRNIYSDNDDIILYQYYHGISTGITCYMCALLYSGNVLGMAA